MDVTFASSGALSRAHYSIVRKVETAQSVHQADQFLALEVKTIHERLSRSSLSVKECKECLVMLMYISATASPGFLPVGGTDFALAHALNLVEAGKSIEDKRIGYLFCAELMPPQHELRLMMVNTLRKDLESGRPGRMCLALDNIVTFANEDIVPAVQDAVIDLISHNYPHIRRRAVLALRSLAVFNPDLLSQSSATIVARLQDRNEAVVGSALIAAAQLPSSDPSFSNARHVVNGLFSSVAISKSSAISLRVLHCLQGMGLSEGHVSFAIDLLNSFSSSREPALLLGIFRLLSQQTPSKLMEAEKAQGASCVGSIQNLLSSHDINDQYLYLACLTCIDPVVWAGTSPDRPLVLEGWEVERIMQFLESPDDSIRKMTLNLLTRIDPAIVEAYLTRALDGVGANSDLATLNMFASRMLDAIAVLSSEDGSRYAQGIKEVLGRMDEALDRPRVLQGAVENVLIHIRASGSDFRVACATTLLTYLVDSIESIGQTFLVIASALAVEYIASISVPPSDISKAFCTSLKSSTPIVQDASLLAILRLVAESDDAAVEVARQAVDGLNQRAGPRIKKRCAQVLGFISDCASLRDIVQGLRSQTLPNFLDALERPKESQAEGNTSGYSDTPASASHKLRYAAYDQPQAVTSRWRRRSSSAHGSVRSDATSDRGSERQQTSSQDVAGSASLSLAAVSLGNLDLNREAEEQRLKNASSGLNPDTIARSDLISLDSPFVTEGSVEEVSISDEFERIWNTLPDGRGARGWCEGSGAELLRRLQCLDGVRVRVAPDDIAPFKGELKVILNVAESTAVVRMKETEDESCLWRLKSEDAELGRRAKDILNKDS